MNTAEIMEEIIHLPLNKKFFVVEQTLNAIKKEEANKQMEMVVMEMRKEYQANKELTSFTSLDLESFYEPK